MRTGVFPSQLKQALVLPLLKKPSLDPNATSSYRPISNLSFISKLIERIVCKHFADHVSTSQLFPAQQSAYRAFHSTETAVLSVHNGLVRAIDNGQVSSLMLLDLSAAFDTVDHDILLEVLSSRFGVNGLALDWFRSYLTERTQTFTYQGKQSVSYAVSCSVPQGSVLGPVEFIAYMEEITEVTDRCEVQSNFYADDIQLYASCRPSNIRTVRAKLSDCAAQVSSWCASRRLKLNADKTEVTWFGSRANLAKLADQDCTLQVTSDTIQPINEVRDLGVLLDAELSLKQHIGKVAATCFYHLRRLRQIRRRVGQDITTRLVLAFITPRLDYCNSVLAGLPQTTIEPLQRVQNAAARLIFNLGPRDHITPSLIQLHWLPVRYRVQYKLCTLMHKLYNGRSPAYLSDIVQVASLRPTRPGLRSSASSDYVIPRLRTKFGERAFSFAGPAAWNSLPADLRAINDARTFQKRLKTLFFTSAFNII
jgi:hypothetical protein